MNTKKTLCLYFQIHQPVRLRKYHFFDIGKSHDYFDDFTNRTAIRKAAEHCYLPVNRLLLEQIRKYGKNFKVSFSISGLALEQFREYAPEVIESFRELAKTGSVEFLAETYSHSLSSLVDEKEFAGQVKQQAVLIKSLFGYTPVTFRNTELIYSDRIGEMVAKMGYATMLTEGAKHILGWKSPNYVYTNALNPKLKLLLKNFRLSDDIALRFSDRSWKEWPLTAGKYASWLSDAAQNGDTINLFMNYETFGEHHRAECGILAFLSHLPEHVFSQTDFEFLTPKEVVARHQPVAPLNVPFPISWSDEERDLTAWQGNELQTEAFRELYAVREAVKKSDDPELIRDYLYLQASDHFYYMSTKHFSDGSGNRAYNPYDSPYEAFINYMNVLSDLIARIDEKSRKPAPVKVAPKAAKAAKSGKTVKSDKSARPVKVAKPESAAPKPAKKVKK